MGVYCYAADGYEGQIVSVEVDVRRGIPGMDVVGLPDGAVREARERVRAAVRNSGWELPRGRILINLSPAGMRKEGAGFDLALAAGLLLHRGEFVPTLEGRLLVLGELTLSGDIRGVTGVLSAVAAARELGINSCIVPAANQEEASIVRGLRVFCISSLKELPVLIARAGNRRDEGDVVDGSGGDNSGRRVRAREMRGTGPESPGDFADIRGLDTVKRALEVAAAGAHHFILFGPPGCGKTLAVRSFPGILPDLNHRDSLEVTRIHSAAGILGEHAGLIVRPPFRSPHHSASGEGLIGGGKQFSPGEVSLAHRGVLFLDETPEYRKNLLQNLREPLETERVHLVRADRKCWYPAGFQLALAANPCPCGNLGKDNGICVCTPQEVRRYWRQLGGALMDRIDLRIPVKPASAVDFVNPSGDSSETIRQRVVRAAEIQRERYKSESFSVNSRIPPGRLKTYCRLGDRETDLLISAVKKLSLSSRAVDSILKVARTIADLENSDAVEKLHLMEALQYRRYGDNDFFWRAG